MTLKELQEVLIQTELPIILHTNRLRWGECETHDEAEQSMLTLATFVTIKADLLDHVETLKSILEICESVAKGRYLEDCQRCHGGDHHCKYACINAEDAHCDMFDGRTPHQAVLAWLDEQNPLRPMVKDWITSQLEIQRGLRAGMDRFFEGATFLTPGLDDEGNPAMVEVSHEEFKAQRAAHDANEDRAHESMANRVDQYALNLDRIRVICQQQGDMEEVVHLITEGMPPQVKTPISFS